MSLDSYTNLKTALVNRLHRSDLTSAIPDFITLCEDKLNKRLRLRAMETRVTASVSSEYVALPDGFISLQNFQINTTPVRSLSYASPDWLDMKYPSGGGTGCPRFYTFVGAEIQLAPVPDQTYTAEMDYYKKWDLETDETNWLLTNAPRAYLYGSLMEAFGYMKDEKRMAMYSQMLEMVLKELEGADDEDRIPGSDIVIRPDCQIV